jgi:hypothetical protein
MVLARATGLVVKLHPESSKIKSVFSVAAKMFLDETNHLIWTAYTSHATMAAVCGKEIGHVSCYPGGVFQLRHMMMDRKDS